MSPLCFTLKDYLGAYGAHAPGYILSPASQAQIGVFKLRSLTGARLTVIRLLRQRDSHFDKGPR